MKDGSRRSSGEDGPEQAQVAASKIDPSTIVAAGLEARDQDESGDEVDGQISVGTVLDPLTESALDLIGTVDDAHEGEDQGADQFGVSFDPFEGRGRQGVDVGSLFGEADQSQTGPGRGADKSGIAFGSDIADLLGFGDSDKDPGSGYFVGGTKDGEVTSFDRDPHVEAVGDRLVGKTDERTAYIEAEVAQANSGAGQPSGSGGGESADGGGSDGGGSDGGGASAGEGGGTSGSMPGGSDGGESTSGESGSGEEGGTRSVDLGENPDGSHTTVYFDGEGGSTEITTWPDGTQQVVNADGSVDYYDKDGNLTGHEDPSSDSEGQSSEESPQSSQEGDQSGGEGDQSTDQGTHVGPDQLTGDPDEEEENEENVVDWEDDEVDDSEGDTDSGSGSGGDEYIGSTPDEDYISPQERMRLREEIGSMSPGAQRGGSTDSGDIDYGPDGRFDEGSGEMPDVKGKLLGGDNVEEDFGGGRPIDGSIGPGGNVGGNIDFGEEAIDEGGTPGLEERPARHTVEQTTELESPPPDPVIDIEQAVSRIDVDDLPPEQLADAEPTILD